MGWDSGLRDPLTRALVALAPDRRNRRQLPLSGPCRQTRPQSAALAVVRQAIARVAGGASKADVLAGTGIAGSDWNRAGAILLERGMVSRTGERQGTRYHAAGA
ncbi:MAG: hypothetical protein AB1634_11030 [Thermodesulfobacteriota bacterium]